MATTLVPESNIQPETSLPNSMLDSDHKAGGQAQWKTGLTEMITEFIECLEYCPEAPITDTNPTYQAVMSEFSTQYDNGNKWFDQMYRTAVTMGEVIPSFLTPITLQKFDWKSLDLLGKFHFMIFYAACDYVADTGCRISTFLLHVDDLGKEFNTLENLQKRIFMGDNSDGTFLQAFRNHLIRFYEFYDAIPANSITLSAINCINGMLLEQNDEVREMKLSNCAHSWPNYLRNKTGCSEAYAFMLFPKTMNLDMTAYISVIDDIAFFTNAVNDILSFYKEHLGGETDTYIFLRARVSGKPLDETLRDVISETLAAHARVTTTLRSTCAAATWKRYVNGYLGFHFTLARYRLTELGF